MNWVKINLRRRLTLFRFVLCFLRSSWAGQVFSSTSKTEKKKKKKKKGKKRTSVITNLFQESILIITLIKHIREIHFCVLDVTELLRRWGVWGFTLVLYMTWLSSPATNVHLGWQFKEIYKGIFPEYMKEKDFNASFVITGR